MLDENGSAVFDADGLTVTLPQKRSSTVILYRSR